MKNLKINLLSSLILLTLTCSLQAQRPGPRTIEGRVIEAGAGQAVAFATVLVADATTENALDGTTTADDGSFSISTDAANFYIEVSFIGFKTRRIDEIPDGRGTVDLGLIVLQEDAEQLEEVVVQGEVSKMEFKLDKRVFNVGSDISSTGMSALEVLNNVPSVNVNIEGEISLRGSTGVQILIDGKPSILAEEGNNALGTITADMIESVEVITNPSAKYDAEGTAGIINIVMKKEEKKGLNGSVSINTGTPDNHSLGISLNRRTEKFNLFTQIGAGRRSLPRDSESVNSNLASNTTLSSFGTAFRNESFSNITLGTDYFFDPKNVLTLSGNFAYEKEDQPSEFFFGLADANTGEVTEWRREETTDANNPKWQYELQFKREFENDEDHTLLFSAIGSFFGKDQSSEFINILTAGSEAPPNQQTETDFQQADFTFKLDYTNPISENYTLETGAQYVINDVGNDYEVRDFIDGDYVVNPDLTNDFSFDQKVLGFYGSGSYESDPWGLKIGLRLEHTDVVTLLANTGETNPQNYVNLFPSVHSSWNISENTSLQAGYSRRIFRPRLWHLNPFFNIRDNFNIRTGNPDLQPEFTDSYELTSIITLGKASLNGTLYYRYTTEVIERVYTFQDNVRISMPMNIGTDQQSGVELNGKYIPLKWLSINGDFNWSYFVRNGEFEDQVFDFTGDRWRARLTSKIGLPADLDLEITGNYRSGYPTVQGEVLGTAFMDLGLRKKLAKGRAVVNIGVRDLFASRIFESNIVQDNFVASDFNQRGRFITLGLSYGFGKGEAMQYSGGRRRF